jgi:hypothetical protein
VDFTQGRFTTIGDPMDWAGVFPPLEVVILHNMRTVDKMTRYRLKHPVHSGCAEVLTSHWHLASGIWALQHMPSAGQWIAKITTAITQAIDPNK